MPSPPSSTWTNARRCRELLRLAAARAQRGGFAARAGARPGVRRRGLAAHRAPPARVAPWLRGCPALRGAGPPPQRRWPACWWWRSWPGAFLSARRRQPPRPRDWPHAADPQAGERVLLVAVGDYLERSQMVLIELANASPKGTLDISSEQERAPTW